MLLHVQIRSRLTWIFSQTVSAASSGRQAVGAALFHDHLKHGLVETEFVLMVIFHPSPSQEVMFVSVATVLPFAVTWLLRY